jgi:hypothetical protein
MLQSGAMEPNFADPSFEPTDEQLQLLAHEAFEGVTERHVEAMRRLRAEIETRRAAVLRDLAASRPR